MTDLQSARVLADPRFVSPARMEELRAAAGENVQVSTASSLDGVELDDVNHKREDVVGHLTPDEANLFKAFYHAAEAQELAKTRDAAARLRRASDFLLAVAENPKKEQGSVMDAVDDRGSDTAKAVARAMALTEWLRAAFYFQLSERLDTHHTNVGIRAGGVVVVMRAKRG